VHQDLTTTKAEKIRCGYRASGGRVRVFGAGLGLFRGSGWHLLSFWQDIELRIPQMKRVEGFPQAHLSLRGEVHAIVELEMAFDLVLQLHSLWPFEAGELSG